MSDFNTMLRDTAVRMFSDLCTRQALDSAERGVWPSALWNAVHAAGLVSALDPEEEGQRLLPLDTVAVLVRVAGEFALPLPLVETLLAQRIFVTAGLAFPEGPLSVAPLDESALPQLRRDPAGGWLLDGALHHVPWGRHAQAVALVAECAGERMLVRLQGATPALLDVSLANEPRDHFTLAGHALPAHAVSALPASSVAALMRTGALFRSLQMVGAMNRVLNMTVQYAMERIQFGRPIGKFQAVQHQVAMMAAQAAAATAATEAAVDAAAQRDACFEIQAAKLRTSEAAGICCNVAHQVHGAMGFTHENALHTCTTRLMSWRDECGTEAECAQWLGREAYRIGGAGLWSYISTPPAAPTPPAVIDSPQGHVYA